jgi:recombination DNA repair RAD52 pathway protein
MTTNKIKEMQNDFNEPFPKEVERQLKQGGASLTYIPVSEVITRLNKVLGFDGWSYEIIKCERDALDPDFVVAHVRLTVYPANGEQFLIVNKDGFGGQKIKRTKNGDIVDLGDEMKGAVSDALKKAAQALGIGLYLARSEEAMEIEAEAEAEASVDPEIESMWAQFVDLSKNLSAEGKAELGEFWKSYAGDRPKPTRQTANKTDLEELIQKCVLIKMAE